MLFRAVEARKIALSWPAENMKMKAQSQAKTNAVKRTTTRRATPRCALCAKLTEWKPAVRKTIDEARRFADQLDSGELTREDLVKSGELLNVDAFIRRLHERSGYVSC